MVISFGLVREVSASSASTTNLAINSSSSIAPLILSGRQSAGHAGTYSAGIAQIIKMLDARMDAQVIRFYVQNSLIAYNPSATELISLKEHGASAELLTALLHRGDALRVQPGSQATETQTNPASAAPPPDMAFVNAPEWSSDYGPPDVGEAPEDPGTVYSFAYYWPWLCQSPVCNSYRPYRYAHGCWYPRPGEVHRAADVGNRDVANVILRDNSEAPPSVSTEGGQRSGNMTSRSMHSRGSRGPVAHSGGRSR